MIPGNEMSSVPAPSDFIVPDELYDWCDRKVDYEAGGVALNDPTQGLRVYTWRIQAVGASAILDVPEDVLIEPVTLFTAVATITEISFTFDLNMQPSVAYVAGGVAYFWYYDTALSAYTTLTLTGAASPRCLLDDRRATQTLNADVLLFYLRDGYLWERIQRDRFEIEYQMMATDAPAIARIGFTTGYRIQIELVVA
jgi:hypothetical protein